MEQSWACPYIWYSGGIIKIKFNDMDRTIDKRDMKNGEMEIIT